MREKLTIIGFTGGKGSGKTTAAQYLQSITPNSAVFSYADPLKQFLMDFMGLSREQVFTLEGKETVDPRYGVTPRRIMEAFGTDFIRATTPNFWVVKMSMRLFGTDYDHIFIDDIRFDDEAELVRSLGGRVIHITGRGVDIGVPKEELPRSERGVTFVEEEDYELSNAGTKGSFLVSTTNLVLRMRSARVEPL